MTAAGGALRMDLLEAGTGVDEQTHWYFRAKQFPLMRYFARCSERMCGSLNLVDVGAGTGIFSDRLLLKFGDVIGSVTLVDTGYEGEEVFRRYAHSVTRTRSLPDRISGSLILLMDVLEHVEDDALFLADLRRRGEGLNYVFVTVPAFMSLWSSHDEFLGHRRRYSRSSLVSTMRACGFTVHRAYYLYASIFPFVYIIRKLKRTHGAGGSDLRPASWAVNTLLQMVLGLEHRVSPLNRFFGVTCVAEGTMVR